MNKMMKVDKIKSFKPDELPTQVTRKLYVKYGVGKWNNSEISLSEYDGSGSKDFESVTLAEHIVTLGIPPQDSKTVKGKVLKLLEKAKDQVLAENHLRLKEVQDKIDNLLAIDYQHSEKEV